MTALAEVLGEIGTDSQILRNALEDRAEREIEQQLREEEARMAHLAESEQMAEWISKDGELQLEQERRKADIRLMKRRAKVVDFLAFNFKFAGPNAGAGIDDDGLGPDETGLEIDVDEPYAIFDVFPR